MTATDDLLAQFNTFVAEETVKVTLDIQGNLKETTPVDVGWATANWMITKGEPFEGNSGSIPESERNSQLESQQAEQAKSEGDIVNYQIEDGAVFITNNVPYIGPLNAGTSTQAPAMFVEAAIDKAVAKANNS